jgi:oxygen-independent coproporphyrinogen-3 oxidase
LAGIYIHIPFCKQACSYCNFYFSTSLGQKDQLIQSLLQEIKQPSTWMGSNHSIDTIYFGGGTPSLLNRDELKAIMEAIHERFEVADNVETTLEANPDDIQLETVKAWMQIGINRLSLGVQSFHEKELTWMNRAHNASDAKQSIDIILAAGIENISVDLIFGSPLIEDNTLLEHATYLIEKRIPHLSCYALTIEPKTLLHHSIQQKQSPSVDSDQQARQFLLLSDTLQAAGYEHYEISNYALPGMRSQHNSSYWKGKPYYGFGPSAHSFDGIQKRKWNIANNAKYIQLVTSHQPFYEEEILTPTQQVNECILTQIRTMEGIDLSLMEKKFGESWPTDLIQKSQPFFKANTLINTPDNRIVLTREGKLFADGIASELFF